MTWLQSNLVNIVILMIANYSSRELTNESLW